MEEWTKPETITIWIVIVVSFVFLLIYSIIKLADINFRRILETKLKESAIQFEHQKKLLETEIFIQEQERERIAADLHDSIIGKLTALRIKNQLEHNREEIDKLIEESIDSSRKISHDLYPPLIKEKTLDELLQSIADSYLNILKVNFLSNNISDDLLPVHIKIQITRVIQEIMTNTYKHAEASDVFINLRQTKKWISILVSDNGKGFDTLNAKKGLGMQNIKYRVLNLNGSYKIKSNKNGTTFIMVINNKDEKN